MSTEEMKTRIEELNIPSRYYSINGNIASDRYIFRQIYTYWECFYIDERGNQMDFCDTCKNNEGVYMNYANNN